MSTIAFLGAGNIAHAIMSGLIETGDRLVTFDPVEACRDRARELGIDVAANNSEAISGANIVMLCVKPNVVLSLLDDIGAALDQDTLVISVAAGITTASMQGHLPTGVPLVRCMPNTPALVKTGMTAMFANASVTAAQKHAAEAVLSAVGDTIWVNAEQELDAVTAVSGSGPAYFFLLMEAMIQAGVAEGLSEGVAEQLVLQTALGAAIMARNNEASPATLRQQVTSPGGTTQAAIEFFQREKFEQIVAGAVGAARIRSVELSEG